MRLFRLSIHLHTPRCISIFFYLPLASSAHSRLHWMLWVHLLNYAPARWMKISADGNLPTPISVAWDLGLTREKSLAWRLVGGGSSTTWRLCATRPRPSLTSLAWSLALKGRSVSEQGKSVLVSCTGSRCCVTVGRLTLDWKSRVGQGC